MKKVLVTITGGALVVAGGILMPLPGPGLLVVVLGLGLLATQYEWARRLFGRMKQRAVQAQKEAVTTPARRGATFASALATATVGVCMIVVADIPWPFLDALLDALWSPVTGGVLVATSLVVVGTSLVTIRRLRQHA